MAPVGAAVADVPALVAGVELAAAFCGTGGLQIEQAVYRFTASLSFIGIFDLLSVRQVAV